MPPTRYYLRGRDAEGKKHSFEITEDRYDEGIQLRGEKDIIAKAVYLPHTSVLVTLEYLEDLDGFRSGNVPAPILNCQTTGTVLLSRSMTMCTRSHAGFPISLKMDGRCQRGILTAD